MAGEPELVSMVLQSSSPELLPHDGAAAPTGSVPSSHTALGADGQQYHDSAAQQSRPAGPGSTMHDHSWQQMWWLWAGAPPPPPQQPPFPDPNVSLQ